MRTLKVIWWNAALSRPRGKITGIRRQTVLETIEKLFLDELADAVFLGEVAEEDTKILASSFDRIGLKAIHCGVQRNLACVFRTSSCQVTPAQNCNHIYATELQNVYVAWQTNLSVEEIPFPLQVWTVHWASPIRNTMKNLHQDCAHHLREKLAQDRADVSRMVIGDFNEEPFSENIVWSLKSTRERQAVIDSPSLLYSPFWRIQGEAADSYSTQNIGRGPGTCQNKRGHKQNALSSWTLVDFALINKPLLTGQFGWKLDEPATRIIHWHHFDFGDHLPICVEFTYDAAEDL